MPVHCSSEAHLMCTSRSGVWLHLSFTARLDPGHAQERTAMSGHLMSHSLDMQSVHSHCQVPYYHGDGSASELITCDWIKYFILYLFLVKTVWHCSLRC